MSNKSKKTKSWDIEKGTVVIVEPMKRIPVDSISALERDIVRSIMPINKIQAAKYFDYGNPLERENKGMLNEDLESYIREVNDMNKFNLGRGTKRHRKRHHKRTKRRNKKHNKRTKRYKK